MLRCEERGTRSGLQQGLCGDFIGCSSPGTWFPAILMGWRILTFLLDVLVFLSTRSSLKDSCRPQENLDM